MKRLICCFFYDVYYESRSIYICTLHTSGCMRKETLLAKVLICAENSGGGRYFPIILLSCRCNVWIDVRCNICVFSCVIPPNFI